jgi:hypothetical protein
MSMLLFALDLNPFLCLLERTLTGIRIGHSTQKTAMVAYADDVTIFVTAPKDINVIWHLLLTYERATGACLNIHKCKAMAAESCNTSLNVFDIPYCPEITMLCFKFTNTVARCGSVTWSKVTGKVTALASEVCGRDMSNTKNPVRAYLFILQDKAQPRFFWNRGSMSGNSSPQFLVHMARCDLQGAFIHLTTSDGGGMS